jgi:hypothetical protein
VVNRTRQAWGAALAVAMIAASVGTAAAQPPTPPVLMASALDNPRGLAFGPGNVLYVLEAGRGGTTSQCLPNPVGPGLRCYGPTGAVTQILAPGMQSRVLTGLPSIAVASGAEAIGPHDLAFTTDRAFITVGSGGDPATLAPFRQAGIHFGYVLMVTGDGTITPLIDVAGFETTANPDGGPLDSNAYSLAVQSTRGIVTDAGGNSLLQVTPDLAVTTLAVFPQRSVTGPGGTPVMMDSVPTTVTDGPDGSLYVGELTGFPFPVDGARVYRVPAGGGTPQVIATGFTMIIDIALAPDGAAYVLEYDTNGLAPGTPGRLTKIGPFGMRTELAPGLLTAPGAIAIGPDNAVYVTVNSSSAGIGEVWKIAQ